MKEANIKKRIMQIDIISLKSLLLSLEFFLRTCIGEIQELEYKGKNKICIICRF